MEGIALMLSVSAIIMFALLAYIAYWLSGRYGPLATAA